MLPLEALKDDPFFVSFSFWWLLAFLVATSLQLLPPWPHQTSSLFSCLYSGTIFKSSLDYHDLENFEDHRLVILQHIPQFGLSELSHEQTRLCLFGRDVTDVRLCGSLPSFSACISLCSVIGDVSFDYLIKMMFAGFSNINLPCFP